MHIFLPSSLSLTLAKASCVNLLTTLETCPYFSFDRDAMHSYPWCSNGMRWNDTAVCILLLKLPFVHYNALSRMRPRTYSNVSCYVVDIRHQIDSRKLPITSYFFLFDPLGSI